MSSMALEMEILCGCARLQLLGSAEGKMWPGALFGAGVRWDYLLWLARTHRALSLVYGALDAFPPERVPATLITQLKGVNQANQIRHLSRGREMCRLCDAFEQSQLPVLFASGWALAESHYPRPALRDLGEGSAYIVSPSRRRDVESVLTTLGYDLSRNPLRLRQDDHSRAQLISSIGYGRENRRYLEEDIWTHSSVCALGSKPVRTPGAGDWVIYLSARGLAHRWLHLGRSADLVMLVNRNPSLDWEEILVRSQRIGLEHAVLLAVAASHRLLGIALPPAVAERLLKKRQLQRQTEKIHGYVASGSTHPWKRVDLLELDLSLQTSGLRKVRCFTGYLRNFRRRRAIASIAPTKELGYLGRFAPTPQRVVLAMLRLAGTTSEDVVCDLGCGVGRIAITAAKEFGAKGVGIDIDPVLVEKARTSASQTASLGRVEFVCADIMTADIRSATVICLYLQAFAYEEIRRKLQQELRPGTRIVSHDFIFPHWPPEKTEIVTVSRQRVSQIYLWRV